MTTYREKIEKLPPERREQIRQGTEKLLKKVRALRNLREHLGITQQDLADRVGISQPAMSRMEEEGRNLTLSSVARVVEAVGGSWELRVVVPDLGDVVLVSSDDFADTNDDAGTHKRRA